MSCRREKEGSEWEGRFRGCGYRWTLSRQAIIEALSSTSDHMSAEEVYNAVQKKHSSIGLATVYRTLEILVGMAVVLSFDFGDKRARYELAERFSKKDHHHHLVCNDCGKVVEYTEFIGDEIELLNKTEKGLSKKYNFKIDNHVIQFYGLCKKCQ
ncbi:MAG: transcriptional repressor [Candidatus Aureabacteria bacterium]|nr:transcriptional repressor [Candidatus Auribacterota bacterium]